MDSHQPCSKKGPLSSLFEGKPPPPPKKKKGEEENQGTTGVRGFLASDESRAKARGPSRAHGLRLRPLGLSWPAGRVAQRNPAPKEFLPSA